MKTLSIVLISIFFLLVYCSDILAENRSATLTATVSVLPFLKHEVVHQESNLVITKEDISKGYIDIRDAITLKIKTNSASGFFITFFTVKGMFSEISVSTDTGTLNIDDGNNELYMPYSGSANSTKALSFRFQLSDSTLPGTYDWPVFYMVSSAH